MLAVGAVSAASLSTRLQAATTPVMRNMGIAPTSYVLRMRGARQGNPPFDLLEHCHSLNLGAVQTRLPSNDPDAVRNFRQKLDSYEMRAILDTPLPRDEAGVAGFDIAVKACKEAGAVGLHAAMTGRRYEDLNSLEAFKKNFEQCQKTVALAEPVLRKHRLPLAIENHKGWRAAEQAAWMKRLGSEWVGVLYDFGNNVSLCEDPAETLRILAPYTLSCHIKDMGVEPYEDGFLLSEVLFGQGIVNLKGAVETLQAKDPKMIFCLEMITRDPLKVPVFTDKYWATFDDSYSPLPGRDLARVLSIVHHSPPTTPLPRTTGMSPEAQLKYEDENNLKCLEWARQNLKV
jgi:sugar phosphate isomerase/epimerase